MYIIRKYDGPVTIMFNDAAYDMDPEEIFINLAPLTGAVFKRDNVKDHKFLKSFTHGAKAWKCIEKSKVDRYSMKALKDHYNSSAKSKRCTMTNVDVDRKSVNIGH